MRCSEMPKFLISDDRPNRLGEVAFGMEMFIRRHPFDPDKGILIEMGSPDEMISSFDHPHPCSALLK